MVQACRLCSAQAVSIDGLVETCSGHITFANVSPQHTVCCCWSTLSSVLHIFA